MIARSLSPRCEDGGAGETQQRGGFRRSNGVECCQMTAWYGCWRPIRGGVGRDRCFPLCGGADAVVDAAVFERGVAIIC